MQELEQQILDLINNNPSLSEDLKKRYILALFLMNKESLPEYLNLMKAFNYRCGAIERGIYILREDEKTKMMKTIDEVKEDILEKIKSNK